MTDICFAMDGLCDARIIDGALDVSDSFETSVIVSLFTDRRADPEDRLSEGNHSLRGCWVDDYSDGDQIGSKLWMLEREKQTEETRLRAIEYASDALQWFVKDGIAKSVSVDAEWADMGHLVFDIEIVRPDGEKLKMKFDNNWNAHKGAA
ncbi:MAG: hypothetical protein GY795_43045 [Desulfobacterales bacterium]|nr:hypothetical protein [Desulfobacterales bacterium]